VYSFALDSEQCGDTISATIIFEQCSIKSDEENFDTCNKKEDCEEVETDRPSCPNGIKIKRQENF
jgi:hypothetical protein